MSRPVILKGGAKGVAHKHGFATDVGWKGID